MATPKHNARRASELRSTAINLFNAHGHPGHNDRLTRENCGACALGGYAAHDETGSLQPNHAGWARAYVQAGRPIPKKFRAAFEDERVSENAAYAAGLATDIATFGVEYEN
jgi:hypothetical protein